MCIFDVCIFITPFPLNIMYTVLFDVILKKKIFIASQFGMVFVFNL